MRVVYRLHIDAADQLCLRDKTPCNPACPNDSDPLNMFFLRPQHGAGDIFRPLQIDHLTIVTQIVKCPDPVRANCKNINLILFHIHQFLPRRTLNNHLIRKTRFLYIFYSCYERVHHIQLASRLIIFLRRHPDDQIVSQSLRPLKQLVMALMKQIKRAICNNLYHANPPI